MGRARPRCHSTRESFGLPFASVRRLVRAEWSPSMTSMTSAATKSREWTSPRARGRWLLFFGIAAAVVILDQLSKAWVAANFTIASVHGAPGAVGGPTQVIGDWVRI